MGGQWQGGGDQIEHPLPQPKACKETKYLGGVQNTDLGVQTQFWPRQILVHTSHSLSISTSLEAVLFNVPVSEYFALSLAFAALCLALQTSLQGHLVQNLFHQ